MQIQVQCTTNNYDLTERATSHVQNSEKQGGRKSKALETREAREPFDG